MQGQGDPTRAKADRVLCLVDEPLVHRSARPRSLSWKGLRRFASVFAAGRDVGLGLLCSVWPLRRTRDGAFL